MFCEKPKAWGKTDFFCSIPAPCIFSFQVSSSCRPPCNTTYKDHFVFLKNLFSISCCFVVKHFTHQIINVIVLQILKKFYSALKKYKRILHTSVGEVSEHILMKKHTNYSVRGPTHSYCFKIQSTNKLNRENLP